jgi:hypothetical protein
VRSQPIMAAGMVVQAPEDLFKARAVFVEVQNTGRSPANNIKLTITVDGQAYLLLPFLPGFQNILGIHLSPGFGVSAPGKRNYPVRNYLTQIFPSGGVEGRVQNGSRPLRFPVFLTAEGDDSVRIMASNNAPLKKIGKDFECEVDLEAEDENQHSFTKSARYRAHFVSWNECKIQELPTQ